MLIQATEYKKSLNKKKAEKEMFRCRVFDWYLLHLFAQ